MEKEEEIKGKKKLPTAICDFIDGTRQAVNFASDTAIDASVGVAIGMGSAVFPQASIPAIISASTIGQTILTNMFSNLTDSAKKAVHELTNHMVPDTCKNEIKTIPVIPLAKSPPTPKTSSNLKPKIKTFNQLRLTHLMIHLGLPESQVEDVLKSHTNYLQNIEEKLDNVIKAQKEQDKLKAEQQCLENLQQMQVFCESLGALGHAIGSKALSQGAAMLGTAVQMGLGIAMCPMNPVAGAAMIIGGIAGVFGLFSEPACNPNQIILDQIGKLSELVITMHEHMAKLFNQNFEMQKTLLDQNIKMQKNLLTAMQQSAMQLSNLIKGEVGSFRVNMQATLHRIETMQHDLLEEINTGLQKIYLKDLIDLQTAVDNYLVGRYSAEGFHVNLINCANSIAAWSSTHTTNPIVNGATWASKESIRIDSNVLDKVFDKEPSITLNTILGFFNSNLSHPEIWLNTVCLYTNLIRHFWHIDFDSLQLEAMKQPGKLILNFCEQLNKKPIIWEDYICNYYNALKNIQETIKDYAKHRSKLWLLTHNNKYEVNEKEKKDTGITETVQEPIKPEELNLLDETIDEFIQSFAGRAPSRIELETRNNECAFIDIDTNKPIQNSNTPLNSLNGINLTKIYQSINLKEEILCAEFLNLISSIKITQPSSISGLNKKIAYSNKAQERALILSESAGEFNQEQTWRLQFEVKIKLSDETPCKIKDIIFQKSWHEMPSLPKFWNECQQKDEVGEYQAKPLMIWNSGEGKHYLNNHIELIKNAFNENSLLNFNSKNVVNISQIQEKIRNAIKKEIIHRRQQMAFELQTQHVNDDTVSQIILEKVRNQLVNLDFYARQLQHLLYLAGKYNDSSESKIIQKKIITSEYILTVLGSYAKCSDMSNLKLEKPIWLRKIDDALIDANKITAEFIMTVKSEFTSNWHPKNIADRGLLIIDLNAAAIDATRLRFSLYRHYIALEQYQMGESKRYLEEALTDIYKLVESTFSEKYKTAKFRIQENMIATIDEKDYKNFYLIFYEWCCTTSRDKNFIGSSDYDLHIFSQTNGWQTLARLKIARGWEKNIALLYKLALTSDNEAFDANHPKPIEEAGLINYSMWFDGLKGLVKMITHPILQKKAARLLAQKASDNFTLKVNLLNYHSDRLAEVYQLGDALYRIIERIAKSSIIEKLFTHYRETYQQLLGVFSEQKNNNHISEKAIYAALVEKQFSGSTIKLLDFLEADRLLLRSYCEIILGYFPWQNKFKIFKTKDEFLAWINPDNSSKNDLEAKLKQYQEEIETASNAILDLFHQIRELIVLQEELLAVSQGRISSIITLERSCLIIHAHDFQFGFDKPKASLLSQFLYQMPAISGIRFIGEDLSDCLSLKNILQFVNKHSQIRTLSFLNSNLKTTVLEKCSKEFRELVQIRQLDLSNNQLIDNNEYVAQVDLRRLSKLLNSMPKLEQLYLYHCGLSDEKLDMLKIYHTTDTIIQLNSLKLSDISSEASHHHQIYIKRKICVGNPLLNQTLDMLAHIQVDLTQQRENLQHPQSTSVSYQLNTHTFFPIPSHTESTIRNPSTTNLPIEPVKYFK